jgi:hypothetical protein
MRLMYRIRELIVLQQEAHKAIAFVADADCFGQRYEYFRERQYQYARLGLKAIIQVRRLRRWPNFQKHVLRFRNGQLTCYVGRMEKGASSEG